MCPVSDLSYCLLGGCRNPESQTRSLDTRSDLGIPSILVRKTEAAIARDWTQWAREAKFTGQPRLCASSNGRHVDFETSGRLASKVLCGPVEKCDDGVEQNDHVCPPFTGVKPGHSPSFQRRPRSAYRSGLFVSMAIYGLFRRPPTSRADAGRMS